MQQLTHDGAIVLQVLAIALLCLLLYITLQAIRGKGIAVLPDWLVPGDWRDICIHRNLVLISEKHKDDPGLMTHVRVHLAQQDRDSAIKFWWRYLTDNRKRLDYEIEAYRAWLDVAHTQLQHRLPKLANRDHARQSTLTSLSILNYLNLTML